MPEQKPAAEKPPAEKPAAPEPQPNMLERLWDFLVGIVVGLWNGFRAVVSAILETLVALFMLFTNTLRTLLPALSKVRHLDSEYNQRRKQDLIDMIERLDLTELQKSIVIDHWIDQINWSSNRANRERDVNELFRWWQIIFSASIPLLNSIEGVGVWLASVAGVFVAVITSVQQFRRPEERWRHYRTLAERYQNELWEFISLTGDDYQAIRNEAEKPHQEAFYKFTERMSHLKDEDLANFFSNVVPASKGKAAQQQENIAPYQATTVLADPQAAGGADAGAGGEEGEIPG